MAKAKTGSKVEATKQFIKYEILGLSLITLSILGLAASGWVGRTVDYVFIALGGNWAWGLEWFMIWVAVYLMVKRERPKLTARLGGFLTFVLVILTWSHLNLYDSLIRSHTIKPDLFGYTFDAIHTQSLYNQGVPYDASHHPIPKPSAGGGLIGCVIFTLTHYLFDTAGTIFVLLMGSVVAVILITKKSLVAMVGEGRNRMAIRLARAYEAIKGWFALLFEKREKAPKAPKAETKKKDKKREKAVHADTEAYEQEEEFAAVAEAPIAEERELTVRSFADQLLAEQAHVQPTDGGLDTLDVPRFVQAPDSPQIQFQFPIEPMAESKEAPKKPIPLKGVQGVEEAIDLPIDLSAAIQDEHYEVPPLGLLDLPKNTAKSVGVNSVKANARKLEQTFESFGVSVKVINVQI
ncbi:MAG: hypothetical protein ACXVDJ_04595, partial [Tumebacillaceae bacterium]